METSAQQQPDCPGCGVMHEPQDCPALALLPAVRGYVARKEWTFAKTMAENPHWYLVFFHQEGADRDGYLALRSLIEEHGWKRRWHGSTWRTYRLDGYDYWHIHPVINRKPSQDAGWDAEQERLF